MNKLPNPGSLPHNGTSALSSFPLAVRYPASRWQFGFKLPIVSFATVDLFRYDSTYQWIHYLIIRFTYMKTGKQHFQNHCENSVDFTEGRDGKDVFYHV